ncbi:ankyrin repeat domain-containing protein [uncultured Brachyspira sp.]|uniref:ankyrin repeat domain-containing protein n=1 Tax=uncultured Brachyspira sp. TaxID=221953 RepID=UPI0025D3356E|nr:ankyrin repeat domain-containing protein [uncultured Brachyspira sp.]
MKHFLIVIIFLCIILSCSDNTKKSDNNTNKALINTNEINTNEIEEIKDYYSSYTDEEIIDFIKEGDFKTIKQLIESKIIDVNYNLDIDEYFKSTILIQAIKYKQTDIINYLLENNADVNLALGYSTPLIEAILMHDRELALKLIDLGADVNLAAELTGFTPLTASAILHDITITELLIEKNADIEARDDNDINALIYAVNFDNEDMVKLLLEKGADANTVAKIENEHTDISPTPLMNAAYKGNTNIINMLLENNADINYATDFGITALMMAANFNRFESAKILLENNADTSVTNGYGKTALDMAKEQDYKDIVSLLEKYN